MRRLRIPAALLGAALLGAVLLCACASQERASAWALDTRISVTVFGGERGLAQEAAALCGGYEARWSRTLAESEISRLNREGTLSVSEDTRALLETACRWARRTEGAFDPTLGAVTGLWDFTSGEAAVPDGEAVAQALALCGYERLTLEGDTASLTGGARLDLGGVAKGAIADALGDALRGRCTGALVNLGGDVLCLGTKEDGAGFLVGIQYPFREEGELIATVTASDMAVVTSGVYRRCFRADGVLYHHILDPETGYPAQTDLLSVTILTPSAADGDALATACLVLGAERGMALVDELEDAWAVFVTEEETLLYSEGCRERFSAGPA